MVAALAVLMLVVSVLPAGAHHGVSHSGPWQRGGYGPNSTDWTMNWEFADGEDATCGPASGGDGWACDPHISNLIRYYGRVTAPSFIDYVSMELFKGDSETTPPTFGWRDLNNTSTSCGTWCQTPTKDYFFTEDGYWWAKMFYEYTIGSSSYSHHTDKKGLNPWNGAIGLWFNEIKTASQVVNEPPVVTSVGPSGTIRRQTALEHQQQFSMRATDPERHRWTGELEVTDPDGLVAFTETFAGEPNSSGSTATSSQRTLPHKNGTYTWRARAKDTSGTSTAQGDRASGTFDYVWNTEPSEPVQHFPPSNAIVVEGEPATFVIESSDPELDTYAGVVKIRRVGDSTHSYATVTSTSVSDGLSAGTVTGLPPGLYEWQAQAYDQHSWTSPSSPWRPFTVLGGTTNSPPAVPTQVSPVSGATFAPDDPQDFTITTTDPDGDSYVGIIEVWQDGVVMSQFATDLAASGDSSSGTSPIMLEPGSYTWTARAADARGATTARSGHESFTVAAASSSSPTMLTSSGPADGETLAVSEFQRFTLTATDDDGDDYHGHVTVVEVASGTTVTFDTTTVSSGQMSAGVPVPGLGPGEYRWTAVAVDGSGQASSSSPARSFTVRANRSPAVPALTGPSSSGRVAEAARQMFGVRSVDPDGDAYRAEVLIENDQGETVVRFVTGLVPSRVQAHGWPSEPLVAGSYRWMARAIDVNGATSDWTRPRGLTVVTERSR